MLDQGMVNSAQSQNYRCQLAQVTSMVLAGCRTPLIEIAARIHIPTYIHSV